MTKVSTLFDEVPKKCLKPIEFCKYINEVTGQLESSDLNSPMDFDNLKLINRGDYDVIAAWDNDNDLSAVCVYLGHWNDGVVE